MGTDHTIAPLALRERLAVQGEAAAALLDRLIADPHIAEAALLSTCNRTEVYLATSDRATGLARVREAFLDMDMAANDLGSLVVARTEEEAVRHLCAVAAGLQSMVVAEGQILAQVREALERAQRLGAAGPYLGAAFRAAVACGKRVRTETAIGRADISASSVVIELLRREIADWAAQRILLIGAGRMIQVTAERLQVLGAGSIAVSSRTTAAAERLAAAVGGRAIPLELVPAEARRATLIVAATRSPGLMLTSPMLSGRQPGPLWVIDLAVPRDVDPAVGILPGVRLLDIDALRDIQDRHGLGEALAAAATMVEEAVEGWQVSVRTREAVPLIADLRAHVDRQKAAELARTLAQLEHLSEADQDLIREMAQRLTNKMFHHLAVRMKQAAAHPELGERYLEVARFLFERDEMEAARRSAAIAARRAAEGT